jgi:hypothetical protein
MASLAELVAERRARIDAFNANPPDALDAFKDLDLSGFTDALERTPIVSKADALAALDLIRDEVLLGCTHLPIIMCQALEAYIRDTQPHRRPRSERPQEGP